MIQRARIPVARERFKDQRCGKFRLHFLNLIVNFKLENCLNSRARARQLEDRSGFASDAAVPYAFGWR